jgi:penicillin amidase
MDHFYHEKWHEEEFMATPGGIGSNCWTVHGNYTESGSPYLSCDPHLNKQLQSMWYLSGLTWKGEDNEDLYIVGGSVVGIPMFSYGRSKGYAWGPTALNPDNSDLYVEKVKGNQYLFDG